MRIWIVLSSLFIFAAGSVQAEQYHHKKPMVDEVSGVRYGTAGCGLGSLAFGAKPGPIQIAASLLNATGGQSFAITSGTSNCQNEGDDNRRAELFILANREVLEKDISRGSGETLTNLAEIIGCSDSAQLGETLQSKYQTIFPKGSEPSENVTEAIFKTIREDQQLSQNCSKIS
jgi:Protein of unknown function (DUF3015)